MKSTETTPKNMDEYIAGFPVDVQAILQKIRSTIRKAAPNAEETISYKMPTFNLNGHYLVYFAAYKKHVAIYPVPAGDDKFAREISEFQSGKGTLQFPLDKPIPYRLISKVVKYRTAEELARDSARKKKQTTS